MPGNPYAPPEAPVPAEAEAPKSIRGPLYFSLLAAFALFCIVVESRVDMLAIKDTVASGVLPQLPILCFLIGFGALMVGIGRHMYAPWQGKHAFILAAAALAIGLVADFNSRDSDGHMRAVLALGVAAALFGTWVAHRVLQVLVAEYLKQKGELEE